MADSLQFWIGTSSTLAPQRRVTRINSASLNLQLNNAGTVSLTIDRADPVISFVATPLSNCILVYRNGFLVWSGPIWTVDESYSGENRKVSITAIGWFELLNHRLIRSLPGYLLATSAITWSNATYESAVSGFTTSLTSVARDTTNFHAGAGSLGISQNTGTAFGTSKGPYSNATVTTTFASHTPLSSTPTAAKRYKLNFWARGSKSPASVGAKTPSLQVLEAGGVVGQVSLSGMYNDLTYNAGWNGAFNTPTTISGAGTTKGTFAQYAMEWVSAGVATTFKWIWDANPTQLIDYTTNWYGSSGQMVVGGPGIAFGNSGSNGALVQSNGSWDGTFVNGRSYTVSVRWQRLGTCTSGTFQVSDTTNTTLGSTTAIQGSYTGSSQTDTFTFTASANQIIFSIISVWSYIGVATVLSLYDISIQETSADTDLMFDVDDVTLQEYAGDGIYSNMDAGAIATALLQKTNSDSDSKITPGTVQTTQPRTRTYQRFSNIGKEIKALSDIESGFDFVIDPVTKAMNIYNRTNATNFPAATPGNSAGGTSGAWIYSADRSANLRFEYGTGEDNLASLRKTQDSSTVVNRLNVQGKYALGQASDATSQTNYGLFEDLISLPDVIDASTSILPFYANAEIAFRKNPKIIYEIETKTGGNTPRLFIDFNIGDRVTLTAGSSILVSGQLSQQIRIFGVQMSVDAEGNEKLSGLQLSA